MRRNKRDKEMEDMLKLVGLALLIYTIITTALWIGFIALSALVIRLSYSLITNPRITQKLRLKILILLTSLFLLYSGRYNMITNYPVIDEAIRKLSIEITQVLK